MFEFRIWISITQHLRQNQIWKIIKYGKNVPFLKTHFSMHGTSKAQVLNVPTYIFSLHKLHFFHTLASMWQPQEPP